MKRRSKICGMTLALLMLGGVSPVTTAAWRLSRTIQYSGSNGQATGRLCQTSKFGNWHWHGTVHTRDTFYSFSWIERVRSDGHYRNLIYDNPQSPSFAQYPPAIRQAIKRAIRQELNKTQVAFYELTPGRPELEYRFPTGRHYIHPFRPQPGC